MWNISPVTATPNSYGMYLYLPSGQETAYLNMKIVHLVLGYDKYDVFDTCQPGQDIT